MQKTFFKKELSISATQKKNGANNNKKDVMKIQSWLRLFSMSNPNSGTDTGVDGDFGQATEQAVVNFQKANGLTQNGIVDKSTFDVMCEPMKNAFEKNISGTGLRQLVVNTAINHVKNKPFELVIKGQPNSGPWVRAYMDGQEGTPMFWCMGFVQTIIDQAASTQNKNFKTLMPSTFSCDVVGETGLNKDLLHRFNEVRNDPSLVKPGDIFLIQKKLHDWVHTGIIISVGNGIFETIEGNSNEGGSNNGNCALRRVRNFMESKLDVFSIEPLV